MPRIIGASHNELIFDDPLAGCQLGLYYRMPTTKERQGFLNMAVQRKGNKVTMHHAEARMTYGLKILTGIRDGDFVRMEAGQPMPISSDPASPHYHPEWKAELEKGCADLVMALAGQVFDASPTLADQDDDEVPTDEPAEDLVGE